MILRSGMWLACTAGIGIYVQERVAVSADGSRRVVDSLSPPKEDEQLEREGWVHLVNPDGSTYAQIPQSAAGTLAQAKYKDIPESRRPDKAHATALGYV